MANGKTREGLKPCKSDFVQISMTVPPTSYAVGGTVVRLIDFFGELSPNTLIVFAGLVPAIHAATGEVLTG